MVREDETGNVAGGDEEQENDGGDEEEKSLLKIVDDDFVQGPSGHAEMLGIVLGKERDELIGDDLQIGSGALATDVALDEAGGEEIHGLAVVEGLKDLACLRKVATSFKW